MTKTNQIISWTLQLFVAVILLQTLFFKFTAAEESVYIFQTVGMEPAGRIGSGIVELVAAVLLFVPMLIPVGAILALGTISGAIFFHLTILGIEVKGDGGTLFYLAVCVFISCILILWLRRESILLILRRLNLIKG